MTDDPSATGREPAIAVELFAAGFDGAVEIGRGGFGVVYRCLQEDLDRTVAVKVLTADLESENLARFMREQRAMGPISGHPNIVDLYQIGVTRSGRPYLVMPYHAHGSLDARIRTDGPLAWEQALRLGVKIADALETAHRGGTLHRDVKPANILLTDYDEPQLADFGIARIAGGFETGTGVIIGSPAFTAPEVLEGRTPTVASDIYSLGSTLFCALTGHAAFERRSGERVVAQFLRIADHPIPDLRESGIPDDVCAAVEHAMARAPENRPSGAAEFGEELRDVQRRNGVTVDAMHVPAAAGQRDARPDTVAPVAPSGPAQRLPTGRTLRTPLAPLTKFRPPTTTRQVVRRERLLDALRAGRDRRLVVVHGPAGFGKSTLMAQWRDELVADGVAVAWLTVDRDDDNVVWFLSHLVEAVRRVRAEVVGDLGQALEENGDAVERFVLASLINRLHDSGEPLVVVVDDWHRVTAHQPIAAMEFLFEHGCHHLRFVVASRSGSGLPLSRMRVHDELCEIDAASLSFDLAESRTFLTDRVHIPLADDDIEKLRAATDGWVAALQLASLSLRQTGGTANVLARFGPGTDTLHEYLTENVLDELDPKLLEFLLATAVPERVCGDLASVLTGVPDGQAKLEEVAARDLFLARTGDDRRWYRYHDLFAHILRQRLERDHPERVAALHRAAASWFRERHLLTEALAHLLDAGASASAVELLEEDSTYLLDRSQMSTLLGLVAKLPPAQVLSSPRLQLTIGWANTELQRLDVATEARRRALEMLELLDLPATRLAQLRVEADVLQAEIDITADRVAGVKERLVECLANPGAHHPFVVSMAALLDTIIDNFEFRFGDAARRQSWAAPYHSKTTGPYSVAYGYCFAGLAKAEQLDIAGSTELYRRAFRLVQDAGNLHSQHARLTRALLAEVLYLQNRIAEAEELLNETFDAVALGGSVDFMIRHYCLRARILSLQGDRASAASQLDEGVRTADAFSLPRLRAAVDLERIRLGLPPRPGFVAVTRGNHPPAADSIAQMTAELEDEAAVWLMLRAADPEQIRLACDWADERVHALEGTERDLARLHAARLRVSCLWAAGRTDDAEAALIPVTAQCARHGLIRFLLDGGPNIVTALMVLREHTAQTHWQRQHSDLPGAFIDTALKAAR
jgi:serine/threonine-protein kinase PknK